MSRKTAAALYVRMSYAKIVARGHRRPCLYSLRKQYPRRFSPFSRKETSAILFYTYIVYFFVIYFHKKKSRFLFIFILLLLLLFVSPPKTVDGTARCCYRSLYVMYSHSQSRKTDTVTYQVLWQCIYICMHIILYTTYFCISYIYVYYIMYCALLPGSGYRPTRIRIFIPQRVWGCGGTPPVDTKNPLGACARP